MEHTLILVILHLHLGVRAVMLMMEHQQQQTGCSNETLTTTLKAQISVG